MGFAGFVVRFMWIYLLFFTLIIVPFFYFMFSPADDIRYHFSGKAPRLVTTGTMKSVKDNDYIRMTGRIMAGSVRPFSDGLFDVDPSFLMLIEGYPSGFVVHLRSGKVHSIIRDYYMKDWNDKFNEKLKKIQDGASGYDERSDDTGEEEDIAAVLRSQVSVDGRVYYADGVYEPFGDYRFSEQFDINDYYRDIGFTSSVHGSYERGAERGVNSFIKSLMRHSGESEERIRGVRGDDSKINAITDAVIMSAEEIPSLSNFGDTYAPAGITFLVIFTMPFVLFPICLVIVKSDRRRRSSVR